MMKEINVLSFGAGTQSTALLLLAAEQKIHVDLIVFADTGAEPKEVYKHLKVCELIAKNANIPFIITTTETTLEQTVIDASRTHGRVDIPCYTESAIIRRQCTSNYKIQPIQKAVRKFLGVKRITKDSNIRVNMMLGITVDEIQRVRPSRVSWITNTYPLLDLNWNRQDAISHCHEKEINPPRSACYFCPYKSINEWIHLYNNDRESFEKANVIDGKIRNHSKFREQLFLCKSRKPLKEYIEEQKIIIENQTTIFDFIESDQTLNECDGQCFL